MEAHQKKEKQEKFIELRALQGMSYDKISCEINVSKPTLISWAKEFGHQIKILKNEHYESLIESYLAMMNKRLSELQNLSSKALEELSEPEVLKNCKATELLKIISDCHKEMQQIEARLNAENEIRNSPFNLF